MSETIRCSACGRELPIDEFYPMPKTARGRSYWCRECQQERTRRQRAQGRGSMTAAPESSRPMAAILPGVNDERSWRKLARINYRKPEPIPADATWRTVVMSEAGTKTVCTGTRTRCLRALERYVLPIGSDVHIRIEPERR